MSVHNPDSESPMGRDRPDDRDPHWSPGLDLARMQMARLAEPEERVPPAPGPEADPEMQQIYRQRIERLHRERFAHGNPELEALWDDEAAFARRPAWDRAVRTVCREVWRIVAAVVIYAVLMAVYFGACRAFG